MRGDDMQCRFCDNTNVKRFLELGEMPLANAFLTGDEVNDIKEPRFPLDVFFCDDCGLVQIGHVVPPQDIFKDYIYFSSTSDAVHKHAQYLAQSFKERFKLHDGSFVVEVASNDGCVLNYFKNLNVNILGVEPAENIAKVAVDSGIETYIDFFNEDNARTIKEKYGSADVILARHVFAHVPEIHSFMRGLKLLLSTNGVIAIEAPYLVDFIEKAEFDTIYHEHLSYLSLRPMSKLFKKYGMEIFDVEHFDIHGGSLIYFISNEGTHKVSPKVGQYVENEIQKGFDDVDIYYDFAGKTSHIKTKLMELLQQLKHDGHSIAAYGAPAKGNTLLNYCGISTDIVDYIVDKSKYKQGLYTPGTHIPVYSTERLLEDMPDYTLLLAWNFADEILGQQKLYREKGGKFIIPIPDIKVV
ncbi:MAG: class I SAM-dependent methyltransferase [Candidatus Methanoperedens sp.]|jgi:2-polyprenyl-3-methyl-5-hydroxy-6-metoxy-1,4-benzoquinol methylase|nr:class I SAM-dependent methyltransferase [Candidatus Methanoperedens sp.]PKL53728.1 MAG: methyltransferase [Candidatus Methanoperedenaceae archaeon HGW-Methanoperedenaceae-1]